MCTNAASEAGVRPVGSATPTLFSDLQAIDACGKGDYRECGRSRPHRRCAAADDARIAGKTPEAGPVTTALVAATASLATIAVAALGATVLRRRRRADSLRPRSPR
jgi:hypothetical protein